MPKQYPRSIDLVREFHTTFGHPVAHELTKSSKELRRLRVMLLASELAELAQALGVSVELAVFPDYDKMPGITPGRPGVTIRNGMVAALHMAPAEKNAHEDHVDLAEAADALARVCSVPSVVVVPLAGLGDSSVVMTGPAIRTHSASQ